MKSISTTWYGSPASTALASMSSASSPESAEAAVMPKELSISTRASAAVALSSTTITRTWCSTAIGGATAVTAALQMPKRTVKWKRLPTPGVLLTLMVPPISSTSCLEMVRPRPVPPYLREIEPSAWLNDWNSLASCSSFMPIPVSLTEKRRDSASAPRSTTCTATTISPFSVNLTALLVRLIRIWPRRSGSPISVAGTPRSTLNTTSTRLASLLSSVTLDRCSKMSPSLNGTDSSVSLPASILEKSRMSLITPSRCSPAPWILVR